MKRSKRVLSVILIVLFVVSGTGGFWLYSKAAMKKKVNNYLTVMEEDFSLAKKDFNEVIDLVNPEDVTQAGLFTINDRSSATPEDILNELNAAEEQMNKINEAVKNARINMPESFDEVEALNQSLEEYYGEVENFSKYQKTMITDLEKLMKIMLDFVNQVKKYQSVFMQVGMNQDYTRTSKNIGIAVEEFERFIDEVRGAILENEDMIIFTNDTIEFLDELVVELTEIEKIYARMGEASKNGSVDKMEQEEQNLQSIIGNIQKKVMKYQSVVETLEEATDKVGRMEESMKEKENAVKEGMLKLKKEFKIE